MAERIFKIECGMDLMLKLSIDTDVLKPEWAKDISHFWITTKEVMDASDDDEYQAVARYAAPLLWGYLLDGYSAQGVVEELHEQEGWCIPTATLGITILDHDIPDLSAEYLEVEEMPHA